jgi:hypothetical protein
MKLTRKKGGSVQHSQSPIMAKVRAVMTLNYRPQQFDPLTTQRLKEGLDELEARKAALHSREDGR